MEEKKVKLKVQGLANSQVKSGAYALVLAGDGDGMRRIPVIIGMFEAQSIAVALEKITPPRPLTHDLFVACTKATGFLLKEVFIYRFNDGIFYSEIVLDNGRNEVRIDSRTSDAIAIALRAGCEIYTTETILRKCGIILEEEEEPEPLPEELTEEDLHDPAELGKKLHPLKRKEIRARMEKAVAEENYEFAKIYRDELLRREEENNSN
ncbi:MAG: bifunctional nuclease family protein [Tannerella sp.]|jgi:bifunctional DNase/RNase|nr:bifunctional nuclease family protein [Tannerella sp.]